MSSLDEASSKFLGCIGLRQNGKRLGLLSKSFSGADRFDRECKDASTIQAVSCGSSMAKGAIRR